jgi:hypothetical protein
MRLLHRPILLLALTAVGTLLAPSTASASFATQTTLTASSTSVTAGDNLHLGTVTTGDLLAYPTGWVTFADGSTTLGTVGTNDSAQASFDTDTLSLGTHELTATFVPTLGVWAGSVSNTVEVHVLAPTALALTASKRKVRPGKPVTLSATLAAGSLPTGGIGFYDGDQLLATIPIRDTSIRFTTIDLAVGTHQLTARYTSDGTFADAVSTAVTVNVAARS